MPKRGLRLDIEECNHIIQRRYLAKKRKDLDSRVRLRSILLVHEGKTLAQVGQILEVARSTAERWIKRHRDLGVTVKRRFRISYSPSQIRRVLHELGFSLQYPRQELSKTDEKRQAKWLEEELPDIKKSRKGQWRSYVSR